MDKITLNEEQITLLKDYIRKRGFTHPVEIQEILDHFACKVEELLQQHPDYTFQNALHKAHTSFGVKGFAPIVQTLQDNLSAQYKSYYYHSLKKQFLSPITLIFLFLLGVAVFRSITIPFIIQNSYFGTYVIGVILFFNIGSSIAASGGNWKKLRSNYYYQRCHFWLNWVYILLPIYLPDSFPQRQPIIAAVLVTLILLFAIVESRARYSTLRKAQQDYDEHLNLMTI